LGKGESKRMAKRAERKSANQSGASPGGLREPKKLWVRAKRPRKLEIT